MNRTSVAPLLGGLAVFCVAAAPPLPAAPGTSARISAARLSVPFVANAGQTSPRVAFYAPTFAGTVFVTDDGSLVQTLNSRAGTGWSIAETFVGGRPCPEGGEGGETRVSSFVGDDATRWRTDLPTYRSISLGEVWDGVEVSLAARARRVEKIFTVWPGASPDRIRIHVAGAGGLRADGDGRLVAATGSGEIAFAPPIAFQEWTGERRPVEVAYAVSGETYGFRLGDYDPGLPLVIDPLLQSTYLGGGGDDYIYQLAFHPTSGDPYVVGQTTSVNFPGTSGGAQSSAAGTDAFVAHFDEDLKTLVRATYLGGSGFDTGSAIAIHPTSGDVYVYGQTVSTDFPGRTGGTQATIGGGGDAFVSRLSSDLTTLVQSTYYGGPGNETASSTLAIHPTSGEIYFAGFTQATSLPGTTGGAQAANAGFVDGFVVRASASLTGPLLQATFLGGGVADQIFALVISPTAGVYVAGSTNSSDFPGTAGGGQPAIAPGFGNTDVFLARLNAGLTSLTQASYFGGNGLDTAFGLAIHPTTGEVYVTGGTASSDLPATAGSAQPSRAGPTDCYVARFNSTLTSLLRATYRGGTGPEGANAIAVHPSTGDVYMSGITVSSDYPGTAGGAQAVFGGGGGDVIISRFNATLTAGLNPSTYLGGNGDEEAISIRVHPTSGEVYAAGYSFSTNYPGTAGGAQAGFGGGVSDGVVTRLTPALEASPAGYYTVTPCRLLDTRNAAGPLGGPSVAAGTTRTIVVAGNCGIAATARALAFNITAVTPTAGGHLRVFPAGALLPTISMMNYSIGQTRANNGITTLGVSGDMSIYNGQAAGVTHVVVDVVGYFR
jgi:hypothetical protein